MNYRNANVTIVSRRRKLFNLFWTILLLFTYKWPSPTYHLTAQVAGDVGDVYPAAVALPYHLGELDVSLLLHPYDEAEQTAVVGLRTTDDIGCAAEDMVAILGTAHKRVELLAAVATTDHDRLAPRLTYGV